MKLNFEPGFEPERYELDAAPAYRFAVGRRDFFKSIGSGIVVVLLVEAAIAQETGGGRWPGVTVQSTTRCIVFSAPGHGGHEIDAI